MKSICKTSEHELNWLKPSQLDFSE